VLECWKESQRVFPMWQFSPFRLDVVNQALYRGDTRVPLMPKPFAVLQYLVEHAGRLVTQDELLTAIWPETYVQPEVLRRYVLEIRRVLGDRPERRFGTRRSAGSNPLAPTILLIFNNLHIKPFRKSGR
jgi:DNA-binding response OmpR family regulator